MSRAELEASVASDCWWICAIKERQKAYADETEADLEAYRELIIQPLPLEERVRRYAPPLVAPARISIPLDVKRASDNDLVLRFRAGRRQLTRCRMALDKDVIDRARKLAAIHRRRLGVG